MTNSKTLEEIDTMNFAELKEYYNSAIVVDEELGFMIPGEFAFDVEPIIAAVARLIAETDSDYDPESGEPEPDFRSAAIEFLSRDDDA